MSSELLATYSGLGTHDGERYFKGEECLGETEQLKLIDTRAPACRLVMVVGARGFTVNLWLEHVTEWL